MDSKLVLFGCGAKKKSHCLPIFKLPAHCVLSFSFSAGFGSDMTGHLPQTFFYYYYFFSHFQTAKWIKSAAVLKHALGPGFTSVAPNGFVFCTCEWWCMCICLHAHIHGFECMCILPFFTFPSTVSTQSQRLWDYQSPFVFRREPSWLGGGLRWEPSGLYSKQFPLRLPCPLHIVTKAIYFKGRRNSNFMWCVFVKLIQFRAPEL